MKKIIILLICILSLSIITGCENSEVETKEIVGSVNTMKDVMEKNNYIILDVRTKEEYEEGHVKDSINIPYDEIDENVDLDKDKTIMVYCKSGKRSSIAYSTLKDLGYDVLDLGAYDTIGLEKTK